ncbi:serine/threonine-protein kinase [Streptosporangium sp. NPDC048865]|uniref:serine/threonine-protein kinase n=1 Tax=Streptosporangium sp. NPDC048865 TaxID=3155766 RepID=UPI0034210D61
MSSETINGRFQMLQRLGSGGMGEVWRVYDNVLGRDLAIKFVGEQELRDTPGAEAILRDEAKTAGSLLGQPQVVSVLDLLDVDTASRNGPALLMEYIDGCTLQEWMAVYSPKLDQATKNIVGLYIALEVTRAIEAAHRRNILHRDIKPLNTLISREGSVKVADFGLARVVDAITRTHTVWGRQTPLYAAPEQWNDEKPDEATDMYQLCATLYHFFAGVPANEGNSILGLLQWHQTGSVKPLAERAPSLNGKVADLITRGLVKDGEGRPAPWNLIDEISGALMHKINMSVSLDGCTEEQMEKIAHITTCGLEEMKKSKKLNLGFPDPFEATQEAIAILFHGGQPLLSFSKPVRPAPSQPPAQAGVAK